MVSRSILNTAKKYVHSIPADMGVKKAYLFGSFAKGREREGSDIDIALIFDHMPDFFETQLRLMKLRRGLDMRIEPHPMLDEEFLNGINPFAKEIEQTGLEIPLEDGW